MFLTDSYELEGLARLMKLYDNLPQNLRSKWFKETKETEMPYVAPEERTYHPSTPGQLAFAVTSMVLYYLEQRKLPITAGKNDYSDYATVIGVLETVKDEITRRLIVPYEIEKCAKNGDVFEE